MTRPDFAELAREWLHRTTSITSASPETERAIAQEFERVWQLGAEARAGASRVQLSSGRGLRGPDRGPILSGVGARCSPPERKTAMTTSLKTIYGDATVTATAPDADGDISYRVCLANGTELSQLCWSQEIAQAKLAAMHDHHIEECARKAPGSAAAAAYHAGNERIVGAGPDES